MYIINFISFNSLESKFCNNNVKLNELTINTWRDIEKANWVIKVLKIKY